MTQDSPAAYWQDIGWNSLFLQLPPSWQPAVIYPAYLYFEQDGQPVLEVKWQKIHGRFSAAKILAQLGKSLEPGVEPEHWDLPEDLHSHLASYTVTGFQLRQEHSHSHGLVIFCPACNRVTLLQWYIDTIREHHQLARILGSFRDHSEGSDRLWTIYDIRAHLPGEAELQSHEFLPGRYTLCFDLKDTAITLYRFKPAAVLLNRKNIGEFGRSLMDRQPLEEDKDRAFWQFKAEGMELLLAKARRNPVFQWMRLWHEPRHNVILGIRAEGKRRMKSGILDRLCANYTSLEPH
ncbi:MAG: hypothetical protein M8357_06665 [Desulfobulbaceae bacterium]|nr:hypothetical protein [Desulfobulbaceae bacterium]